jgi:hypothetical protein
MCFVPAPGCVVSSLLSSAALPGVSSEGCNWFAVGRKTVTDRVRHLLPPFLDQVHYLLSPFFAIHIISADAGTDILYDMPVT